MKTAKALKCEASFPSSTELIVASALLLLSSTSTTTPTNVRRKSRSCVKVKNEFPMATTSRTRKLQAIATFVARFQELKKLQVSRKKRSRTYWVSRGSDVFSSCKSTDDRVSPSASGSTSTVSCLTNSSCVEFTSNEELGEAKSSPKRKLDKVIKGDVSNRIGSGHIRRRADAILNVLSTCDSASEVRIREILGDSPDTSKALRILLRRAQVKRHGAGGRGDPYTYSIA